MENKDPIKRAAIFVCHDKAGIIDDYIPCLLRDLAENLETLIVVVNGELTPEGRSKLEGIPSRIFTRENQGFDTGAWKEAMIDRLGWEALGEFDELILLNDSFFGPFYSFRQVFEEMDRRPVDFWGLTARAAAENPAFSQLCPYDYLPAHIQFYFVAVRKKMFSSQAFRDYWETQPVFQTREEGFARHEAVFTKHFEDAGFAWEVFSDTSDLDGDFLDGTAVNHCMVNTYELLAKKKCPVINKSIFGVPYIGQITLSTGEHLRKSLDYINRRTAYDTALIYRHILRICNITDIFYNLNLVYSLSKKSGRPDRIKGKTALVFFIFYNDFDYLRQYICEIPEFVDVILVTKPEKNVEAVRRYFSPLMKNKLRVVLAKDPGRDLSALLVAANEYLKDYDYIGFCHDKRTKHAGPVTAGASFQDLIVENTIGSGGYIENVLHLLEDHPELGFLSPPPPHHGAFFGNYVLRYWSDGCMEQVKGLVNRLKLTADISVEKMPLALGTAFWCKRDALAPLFDYPWTYGDFPPEPLAIDNTLNHGLERIFPYVAQSQGYLSGWAATEDYISTEICNLYCQFDQALHGDSIRLLPADPNIIQNTLIGMREQSEKRAAEYLAGFRQLEEKEQRRLKNRLVRFVKRIIRRGPG